MTVQENPSQPRNASGQYFRGPSSTNGYRCRDRSSRYNVIPQLAANIKALKEQRDTIAGQVEDMLEDFPASQILDRACRESAILTAAQILLSIGDASDFASSGHLAAYAGIAPVTRRSGSSIQGELPARAGNKRLKNAMSYSAFAATRTHETSRTYYERKRAEGKRHNAALMCLARRRCNVIYAMLKNKEYYREIPTNQPVAA